MKRVISMMLLLTLLAGCGRGAADPLGPTPPPAEENGPAGDLMAGVDAPAPETDVDLAADETADAVAEFGVKLLQNCLGDGNTLVSPLSVLQALGMTANGAAGDTLTQMEAAFGADMDALNAWLYAWSQALPDEESAAVHTANGIWLNAGGHLTVEPDFLKANGTYYGAGVYEETFEPDLAEKINGWVAEHTADRIRQIIDEVPADAMVYLVNAMSFDGVWEDIYREDQVRPGTFTAADGSEQDADFMWSMEGALLQDEQAVGFIKYYEGRSLAFAALLPEEGVSLEDYAATLTGERLRQLLTDARTDLAAETAIPKFSAEYGADLARILAAMGIEDAFDAEKADFSRLGKSEAGNLYISRVMHKCTIDVDEQGTRAGAATAVEVRAAGLLGPMEQVVLDRPFLYMLIDCQTNVPLFIGTVESF